MESKYDHHAFFHHKKQTNADRIRQMSDEEMAAFIENDLIGFPWCNATEEEVDPDSLVCKRWDCVKCAMAWLKQEADNGGSD